MTRINFTDAANLAEAVCRIKELFGTNPFTSKEYNADRPKGAALLSTLEGHNVVMVVKTETFEKEVDSCYGAEYVLNANNESIMKLDDFKALPQSVQEMITKAAGGIHIEYRDVETITCKRYYYQLNPEAYERYLSNRVAEWRLAIEKKERQMAKLAKEVDALKKVVG
jgi:hypothetical protein